MVITMRELLDVLESATEAERQEFSEWWGGLPIPDDVPVPYGSEPKTVGSQLDVMVRDVDFLKNGGRRLLRSSC